MKRTVLVIEDDKATAGMVQEVLEAEGYRVLRASDGDGLPVAMREKLDVILLDVNMPGMNGPEVSQRLRANPATAHVPIIGMSAFDRRGAKPPDMLADDWLPKPFLLDELIRKVARWSATR